MTKIIQLKDGINVEVEIPADQAHEIAFSSQNTTVDNSIDEIQSLLTKVIHPFTETYRELNKNISLESAKVAIGINIGIEGNFILAKSNLGANIQVEITFKAPNE